MSGELLTVRIVKEGSLHTLGLIAVRLRKAAVEALVHRDHGSESEIASAIMLFNRAHQEMPNLAIYDPYGTSEMKAHLVLRRVCGETIAVYGSEEAPAEIRWLDLDNKLLSSWSYRSLEKAIAAVRRWNIANSPSPTGYIKRLEPS